MSRYSQYPRFFVRETFVEGEPILKIAKAETPEDVAQYTAEAGWSEYGPRLSGDVKAQPQAGHTMGFSAELHDTPPSQRLWRSLVRVHRIAEHCLWLVIPSWNPDKPIALSKDSIPDNILLLAAEGRLYFHARVNIGAETADELRFTEWEEE